LHNHRLFREFVAIETISKNIMTPHYKDEKVKMTVHETWLNVGNKIRFLRKSNGLTLKQLARGCGLSANTISMVERSEVSPSIETLCKIANALGVSPSSLFLEVCRPQVVLQRADEASSQTDIAGQTLQVLATASFQPGCMPVTPKASKHDPEMLSSRWHSILCLCGQVELELDGQNYCLNPGDSLAFNSDAFHRWRNSGSSTGIAVLILPSSSFKASPLGK
jgi:transcriptional regulator with XRE-family HTH domain